MCCLVWLLIQNIKSIIVEYIIKLRRKEQNHGKIISLPYDSGCCGRCEKINDYIRGWTFIEIIPNNNKVILNECINCNVPSEYSLKADLPPIAPRDVSFGYSNQKNNHNQPPIILLNGGGVSRTGTLPRKVYNNFDEDTTTFIRNDKKKRASFSLPSSPKVSQNYGMKKLDNWIGNLIKNG
ncbi:Hypothetical protein SRAE_2000058200 [Strongyloides ratti]|uniref:Uncharacterized protein n=1 Tax=Strongyloides ratti TaxID=34506 RepID=A0A090LCQ8_STRRB|nr:Hypothetical protein SRAE_2000058200 [Strongyloides ratti]CEF65908.1 Hypothetical protein SRAE_2000058200 [Strongyloides ratti]